MEDLMSMEELREIAKNKENEPKSEELPVLSEDKKALGSVGLNDIEFTVDKSKSYEEQAADVVGAMATAKAVSDEAVQNDLAVKKAEELKAKASAKEKAAEATDLAAETEMQIARRNLYEAVLEDFMITKHLPQWLMMIVVGILSPLYILKILLINVPLGFGKTLMDCIDNIFIRYSKVNDENKPKVRITVWIFLGSCLLALISITVLKILGKI